MFDCVRPLLCFVCCYVGEDRLQFSAEILMQDLWVTITEQIHRPIFLLQCSQDNSICSYRSVHKCTNLSAHFSWFGLRNTYYQDGHKHERTGGALLPFCHYNNLLIRKLCCHFSEEKTSDNLTAAENVHFPNSSSSLSSPLYVRGTHRERWMTSNCCLDDPKP